MASARHRARVRVIDGLPPYRWEVEIPGGLIRQELRRSLPEWETATGRFGAVEIAELARILRRTAELAISLPDQAAQTYAARVKDALSQIVTSRTEAERLVKQRIGQDTFREALLDYWNGACAITGLAVPEVLRASHAKPWADCNDDEERLDVFNGFLLSANLDALFDRGLITFDDTGKLLVSSLLPDKHRISLHLTLNLHLRWLAIEHLLYLHWHQEHVFQH